jgi:hypothetical protein
MQIDPSTIDWTKVKKSPIPKGDESTLLGWYRGSGIKIAVYENEMWIMDAEDSDKFLATRKGGYSHLSTGEVKKMAAAMLAAEVMKNLPEPTFIDNAVDALTPSEHAQLNNQIKRLTKEESEELLGSGKMQHIPLVNTIEQNMRETAQIQAPRRQLDALLSGRLSRAW